MEARRVVTRRRHGPSQFLRPRKNADYAGRLDLENYEFSLHLTIGEGTVQIPFRLSAEGKTFYFVEFDHSWQTINVTKRNESGRGVTKLSAVNFPVEFGRDYHLIISARQQSLTTYIDGNLLNQVTDDSYSRGGVGLGMWWTTTATFRDPKIRHYKWP